MDPRTAAHVLELIGELLELQGENRFRTNAYRKAAHAVRGIPGHDLRPLLRSGELARVRGVGPATLRVLRELVETGGSAYLDRLRARTPESLAALLRVPGLGRERIIELHETLGISSLEDLDEAAASGQLVTVPGIGPRTAAKIRAGIARLRETGTRMRYPEARVEAERLVRAVGDRPDVDRAAIAGSVRRHCEIARDIDIVAGCPGEPVAVAASIARTPGISDVRGLGTASVSVRFVGGTALDVHCVPPGRFAMALWRATGSAGHEAEVVAQARARGYAIAEDTLRDGTGTPVPVPDEETLYAVLGMPYIEPELREGRGEVAAALAGTLPALVTPADIRGVLHCHTTYSDGKASIAEMALAARDRGWSFLGISDHSRSAFYAGGLSADAVLAQHEEIDRLNDQLEGVRLLKGIEADVLRDGRIDYEADVLDRFDFVIASVHSRFSLDRAAMTARVLRALDDPHVTILGHPTGRLLLARDPYAIDLDAVIEKAAATGVALELNADPHRLDLDWRWCQTAVRAGCTIAIGPDAHSVKGLDTMEIGVQMARKGWLSAGDVLNARSATEILAFARRRRSVKGAPRRSRLAARR